MRPPAARIHCSEGPSKIPLTRRLDFGSIFARNFCGSVLRQRVCRFFFFSCRTSPRIKFWSVSSSRDHLKNTQFLCILSPLECALPRVSTSVQVFILKNLQEC